MATKKSKKQLKAELDGWGYTYNAAKRRGDKKGMVEAHAKADEIRKQAGWKYDEKTGRTYDGGSTVNSHRVTENAKIKKASEVKQWGASASSKKPEKKKTTVRRGQASSYNSSGVEALTERGRTSGLQDKAITRRAKSIAAAHDKAEDTRSTARKIKDARPLDLIASNLMGAVGGFNQSIASTADFLLPDQLTPKPVQGVIDYYKGTGAAFKEDAQRKNRNVGGKAGAVVGDLAMGTLETLPQLGAALMTGGGSTAAQLGAGTGKAMSTADVLRTILKKPSFAASLARTLGPEYDKAKADGASDLGATLYALTSGGLGAAVETAGGLENIPQRAPGVGSWLKSAAEEGAEEVVQGVTSQLARKATYAPDTPFFSMDDSEAVFNPRRMAGEFGTGAVISALLGAPTMAHRKLGSWTEEPAQAVQSEAETVKPIQEAAEPVKPVKAGRATTIFHPYDGKTPENRVDAKPREAITVPAEAVVMSGRAKAEALETNKKSTLKNRMLEVFRKMGGQRRVAVEQVSYDGEPYVVDLNTRLVSKVVSGQDVSPERLSVLYVLDDAVKTAEYVGSGRYGKNKPKKDNVVRYDYFENEVMIGGEPYVLTFDVEIIPGQNNFRTYRVINEMNLTPTAALIGPLPIASSARKSGSFLDTSVPQDTPVVKPETQTLGRELPPQPEPLRQGTWQEGEVKPRLRPEYEVRPESTLRTAEEEAALQAQLAEVEAAQNTGKKVFALDRNNYGEIVRENMDGTADVLFTNRATGTSKQVTLDADAVQAISEGKMDLPAEVAQALEQKAQGQLDALNAPVAEPEATQAAPLAEPEATQAAPLDEVIRASNPVVEEAAAAMRDTERTYQKHQQQRRGVTYMAHLTRADQDAIAGLPEELRSALSETGEAYQLAMDELRRRYQLTEADLVDARQIAKGKHSLRLDEIPQKKLEAINAYAILLGEYNEYMKPTFGAQHDIAAQRRETANSLIAGSDKWVDKRGAYVWNRMTPERVIKKLVGDADEADAIIDEYIKPVHEHEAQSIRWQNDMRDRLRGITKDSTKEESVYLHLLNRLRERPDDSTLQTKLGDYLSAHKDKINELRVEAMMKEMVEMTREIHANINGAYIRNGVQPIPFRQNYIPSLQTVREGRWWNKVLRKFGIETMADEIPTTIAGNTGLFRPGKKWQSSAQERRGVGTEFDAVKAMDNYITNAGHAIFHTDDVQKLRILDEAIRYRFSDDAVQAELSALDYDDTLDGVQRMEAKQELWDRDRRALPSFPAWLTEYTNQLAGKKSMSDRAAEMKTGRGMYQAMSDLETKVARNLLGGNLSSALTNFAPLAQGKGEVSSLSLVKATVDYARDLLRKDHDYVTDSDFLTNRTGSAPVVRTTGQKLVDATFTPMQLVDDFTSNVLHRARMNDNIKKRGMSDSQARAEADSWTAGLMGDRSLGAMPNSFGEKSPLAKALNMFQLELNNQYGYFFQDMPERARADSTTRAGAAAKLTGRLFQAALASYLFNEAFEELTGYRPLTDGIHVASEFVGDLTGYMLPDTSDALRAMFTDETFTPEMFETEQTSATDAVIHGLLNMAGQVPTASMFIEGGGRIPLSSAMPDFKTLGKAVQGFESGDVSGEMLAKTFGQELAKPAANILLPAGWGQIKKTLKGADMLHKGGLYKTGLDGKTELQFPYIDEEHGWPDDVQAIMFGPWATKAGRQLREDDFKTVLGDKETRLYNSLRDDLKADERLSYDTIQHLRTIKEKKNDKGDVVRTAKEQKRDYLLTVEGLTNAQKQKIDLYLFCGDDENPADYTDENSMLLSTEFKEGSKYRNQVLALIERGVPARVMSDYLDISNEIERNHKGDESFGTPQKKRELLARINSDDTLDSNARDALAESLVGTTKLSEKYHKSDADQLMGVREFLSYKVKLDEIEAKYEDEKNEDGDSVTDKLKDDEFSRFLDKEDISAEMRDTLMDAFSIEPTPYKWSHIEREGGKNVKQYLSLVEDSGLSIAQYVDIRDNWKNATNKDGTHKYKAETIKAHMRELGWTHEQIYAVCKTFGWSYSSGGKKKSKKIGVSGSGTRAVLRSLPGLSGI